MNIFSRGQKGKLADLGCQSNFTVAFEFDAASTPLDVSCFGLDANEKLSDDRFMVFYNQLAAPGDAVKLELGSGRARFALALDALPQSITKLVFVAAIDGGGTMRALSNAVLRVGDALQFPLTGSDFQDEKAVILGEIYRKDGVWRFGAVGQGFNGGLSALLAHFGGSEASTPTPATPAAPVATPAAPAAAKVSLSKVTLQKRGDKVSLDKRTSKGFGKIHVNLNWNQNAGAPAAPAKTGFLAKLTGAVSGPAGIDLDLGCMFELQGGRAGLVQALGNAWGDFEQAPFIKLEGDDRTGQVKTGENLLINGDQVDQIKRALIFAFIYRGAPNWAATDGVVTINMPDQAPIEVRLDQGGNEMVCAIAMIENRGGSLQVTKLAEYFAQQGKTSAHEMMDQRFGFGLRWTTGRKD